jgi:hypothetical protein
MCVIWFVFHILQLPPIRLYNKTRVALAKSTMNDMQKHHVENHTCLDLVIVVTNACLLVLNYMGPPHCVHYRK